MKKLTFKHFSVVTMCLMGASAIASAFVPNNKEEDDDANGNFAVRGITVASSAGGGRTAIQGNGTASYTATGSFEDGLSATSANVAAQTNTNNGIGNYTGVDTTHSDWSGSLL